VLNSSQERVSYSHTILSLYCCCCCCYCISSSSIYAGADGPGGAEFGDFKKDAEEKHGVAFYKSMADLPAVPEGKKRLALISGRTADNPHLLSECIKYGCSSIYLEKPGAPTVAELEAMRDEAAAAKVSVLMGYNKVRIFIL
jgi:Oxidoreductase family, NAD-binding Rossmann fold